MVRSLWTAATGMMAQQINVDTISNNLANANTTGYKSESAEFRSLLYQNLQDNTTDSEGNAKPVSAQVGLGVRNSAIVSDFTQGTYKNTETNTDLAIDGDGFFMVQLANGEVGYTRSGAFNVAMLDNNTYTLATDEGNPLLDVNGNILRISGNYNSSKLLVDTGGNICYPNATNNSVPIGYQIGIAQFTNPTGLSKASGSIMLETDASGQPIIEANSNTVKKSVIQQGFLEASNVQTVDEMVNLIVAQRAYEMNSKIITATDEMMQQANNLR